MDKTREVVEKTMRWVSRLDRTPVKWIDEDRVRVATEKRPWIEFGCHSWGSEAEVRVGDHHVTSVPGTVLVLNAHFRNYGTPKKAWRHWCLSLDVSQSSPVEGLDEGPLLLAAPSRNLQRIVERYELARSEFRRAGPMYDARLKSAVILLLAELFENASPDDGEQSSHSPPVEAAIQFMTSQYDNPHMRLADIAVAAHLSPAHFGRTFKDEVGMAPMKYLTRLRVERAEALLERAGLSVGEVGRAVGFEDPLHFSRVFKSVAGTSPRAYRSGNRNKS